MCADTFMGIHGRLPALAAHVQQLMGSRSRGGRPRAGLAPGASLEPGYTAAASPQASLSAAPGAGLGVRLSPSLGELHADSATLVQAGPVLQRQLDSPFLHLQQQQQQQGVGALDMDAAGAQLSAAGRATRSDAALGVDAAWEGGAGEASGAGKAQHAPRQSPLGRQPTAAVGVADRECGAAACGPSGPPGGTVRVASSVVAAPERSADSALHARAQPAALETGSWQFLASGRQPTLGR
jgi:hypothetical protein